MALVERGHVSTFRAHIMRAADTEASNGGGGPRLEIIGAALVTSKKSQISVMRMPITNNMFIQFVQVTGYEITGKNAYEKQAAQKFKRHLYCKDAGNGPLKGAIDKEIDSFIAWRKEVTGEDLRRLTSKEWKDANSDLGYPSNTMIPSSCWETTSDVPFADARTVFQSAALITWRDSRRAGVRSFDTVTRLGRASKPEDNEALEQAEDNGKTKQAKDSEAPAPRRFFPEDFLRRPPRPEVAMDHVAYYRGKGPLSR